MNGHFLYIAVTIFKPQQAKHVVRVMDVSEPSGFAQLCLSMVHVQIVCNLYSVFFSHSCVHAGGAGHGNALAYGRFNNFRRSF